ncbi:MAG: GntR family transcriptional regulator [Solirubrobacteraceae bacterium]|nr:GntR family transcriptional regulator [Solirubrobacteraceae bacterium]
MPPKTVDDEPLPLDLSLDGAEADEPLVDSVYRALRDAICDGRLEANRKLAQIPLAEYLGISRTPVRDALQRLAQEGLVRAVSWRGFVVSEFSARDVLDIYEVRIALEPLAVGDAVPRYTRMDVARLADNCASLAATPVEDVGRLYDLNSEFHRELVAPCDNRLLVRLLDQLWQMPASLRLFHAQAALGTALKESVVAHRGIVAAIEAGDVDLAVERTREHIRRAQLETINALDEPAR